jgi:hypothetical protein
MFNRELGFEYIFSAILGLTALLASSVMGAAAGVGLGHVAVRSLISTIVFFATGYAAVFVVKKYVPEMYEYLNSSLRIGARRDRDNAGENYNAGNGDAVSGEPGAPEEGIETGSISDEGLTPNEADGTGGFVPLKDSSLPRYTTAKPEKGNLGKHLFEQRKMRYEPKIMAEAIRTMMSRDRE